MKISIRQSGGFAGAIETLGPIETADLPSGMAREIESEIRQLGFLSQPSQDESVGADLMRYEVTVQDGNHERTLRVVDDGSEHAEGLRDLIQKLRAMS